MTKFTDRETRTWYSQIKNSGKMIRQVIPGIGQLEFSKK